MSLIKASEQHCNIYYYYDIFGGRYAHEDCATTKVYSGFIYDDAYTTYTSSEYFAPFDDIVGYDSYCNWNHGFFTSTETCTTYKTFMNGDVIYYTDVYYH
jgi:hypothetical protein